VYAEGGRRKSSVEGRGAHGTKGFAVAGLSSDIKSALSDLDFPAGKQDIVAHAERSGASADVLRALRALPVADYANLAEVLRSAGTPPAAPAPSTKAAQARKRKTRIAERLREIYRG
jgi:hypothetical protein